MPEYSSTRCILLHGHIFKNAGTSLDWSLRQNFSDGFLDHRQDELMLADGRSHLEDLVTADPDLRALSSHHMTADLPSVPGVTFFPVFLLRHPIARMRSVYDFERQQDSESPGAQAAKNKNFRDYVRWRMRDEVRRTIRNYQTLYLAGQHDFVSNQELVSRHVPEAFARLRSATFVGIVERYDESMVVLEEALAGSFGQLDLSTVAQNVSASRTAAHREDDIVANVLTELGDLQKLVIDENSFDLALYQSACQQLQSRIDRIDGFDDKLAAFRARR